MKMTAVITALVALSASSAMAQTYSAEDCAYKNNRQASVSSERQTTASIDAAQDAQPVAVVQRSTASSATVSVEN